MTGDSATDQVSSRFFQSDVGLNSVVAGLSVFAGIRRMTLTLCLSGHFFNRDIHLLVNCQ